MQIAILPMPHVTGASIDRRFQLSIDDLLRSVGPVYNGFGEYSFNPPEVILGSNITKQPQHLYKVFHISDNSEWIFETVFAIEGGEYICLYTKLIKDYTDIAISLNAIRRYQEHGDRVIPLTDITDAHYWRSSNTSSDNIVHSLIPAIFNQTYLDRTTMKLVGAIEEGNVNKVGWRYKPIYDYESGILEALISGKFLRHPGYNLQVNHPDIQILPDKWFCRDKAAHQAHVASGKMHINDPEFDSLALSLILMRPSSMSLTARISHAIDGLLDLSVTRHFVDPYHKINPLTPTKLKEVRSSLSRILVKATDKYCKIFGIDYSTFMVNPNDNSSISIEKNIYDEVTISFHDLCHDRYVCFYSYLPPLLLATLGAGRYINDR